MNRRFPDGAHAVEELRKAGVPDLICHYHFVAAVGSNLFDKLYDHLRGIIRLCQTRTDLFTLLRESATIQWTSGR